MTAPAALAFDDLVRQQMLSQQGLDPSQEAPATRQPVSEGLLPATADIPASLRPSESVSHLPLHDAVHTNDLWERVRAGFAMPRLDMPLVREHENWYANNPEHLKRVVERGRRYLYHIVGEVERRRMPMEIALLPVIESAFNPGAYSHAAASGLWQFIPSTGKRYGLEQTWWYDGRRDVVQATRAALDYLEFLHGMFGDWHLALASYNWGEGAVQRAIERNRAQGLPTDFASLTMPAETRNYVPKLLAVRNVIENPSAYGIQLAKVPNAPYFSSIPSEKHIDLQLAAKLAGMSVDDFKNLNPAYNRPVVASKPERRILLPVDKVEQFKANLASHEDSLLSWHPYIPGRGERLDRIADRFGISISQLQEANGLASGTRVATGAPLLVPMKSADGTVRLLTATDVARSGADDDAEPAARQARRPAVAEQADNTRYTVRRGDTLFSVARSQGVTVAALKQANDLGPRGIKAGMQLEIPASQKTARASSARQDETSQAAARSKTAKGTSTKSKTTTYVVKPGDTLYSIAKRHGMSVAEVQSSNRLGKQTVRPGTKLTLASNP